MIAVIDIETNAIENPDVIWCIGVKDLATDHVWIFERPDLEPDAFLELASKVEVWVGHNVLGYDLPVLRSIIPMVDTWWNPRDTIDTLVVSRLLSYNLEGGHSLKAWGQRLGQEKGDFNDFSSLSPAMVEYLRGDLETTAALYRYLEKFLHEPAWQPSLRLEHDMALICQDMKDNGFAFDLESAKALLQGIETELSVLDAELQTAFPPRSHLIREITPRETKHGTLHRGDFRWCDGSDLTCFSPGHSFSLIEFRPFNPGSPTQIVERLNEAGWRPTEKTKGHIQAERAKDLEKLKEYQVTGWKVSEANLLTLPSDAPPAAQKLVRRLLLASRRNTLREWTAAAVPPSEPQQTAYIHGTFNPIGAWTQRMSHVKPNMANIPRDDAVFGAQMRSLWIAPPDKYLVGVDADGIQLRILAHYMNDPVFTESLVSGDKTKGTDAHSRNRDILGYGNRDTAKTFIYAFVLGAGIPKLADILGCSIPEARYAYEQFLDAYPGLQHLKNVVIPRDADKGYFTGLDGRLVLQDSEHLMLAGYLQAGEAVVMKRANIKWRTRLRSEGIPFWQVNFVHDEWQTYVPRDMELAKYVAEVQSNSIKEVGEDLGLNCPLAGSIYGAHGQLAIGNNWLETH